MEKNIFKQVGSNIQGILVDKGYTQQFLADKLNISKQVMSKIISGNKAINVQEISKIASILGVTIENLLLMKKEKEVGHNLSFMGNVTDEKTREKIIILQNVIDEIILLEEYADGQ